MANFACNNDLDKPYLVMVTRKTVPLTRAMFLASSAGIKGGFDTREEAERALQSFLDDPETAAERASEDFRIEVVLDPPHPPRD